MAKNMTQQAGEKPPGKKSKPDAAPARPITPARLQNYALWYLQKQFPSKNWLRQKLIQFAARKKPTSQSQQEILPLVETLLAALERENIINDQRLAESLTRQWAVRLLPWRKIEMKLTAKGFGRDTISAIKETIDNDTTMDRNPTDEESLARDYAQRKKLGAFRPGANHTELSNADDAMDDAEPVAPDAARKLYQKDLAKMARAGFSYGAATRALKGAD
ncbi:MAG: RecX family transcriptional regulator [Hydrotalea sp.]|nr:RecX family transcriptional regulator [Hydrotalea sp.]